MARGPSPGSSWTLRSLAVLHRLGLNGRQGQAGPVGQAASQGDHPLGQPVRFGQELLQRAGLVQAERMAVLPGEFGQVCAASQSRPQAVDQGAYVGTGGHRHPEIHEREVHREDLHVENLDRLGDGRDLRVPAGPACTGAGHSPSPRNRPVSPGGSCPSRKGRPGRPTPGARAPRGVRPSPAPGRRRCPSSGPAAAGPGRPSRPSDKNGASLVASPKSTSSTPVAMGSRVPQCPIFLCPSRCFTSSRQRAEVGPQGLSSTRTPCIWGGLAGGTCVTGSPAPCPRPR